eukprot:TRINITY_DN5486_c0_g1_i1.p1 TRINITY_DN5486_c0_g1~~TRINITY_DN5486_c0_g1_i1.p1  ORF type:complete len:673 (+),score=174.37 TRINITY_DN5486_c0_g1_i1:137-2155(+)
MLANQGQLTIYDHDKRWKVILHDSEEKKVVLYRDNNDLLVCDQNQNVHNNEKNSPNNPKHSNNNNNHQNNHVCPLCHQKLSNGWIPSDNGFSSFRSKDYFLLLEQKNEEENRKIGGETGGNNDQSSQANDPLSPEFLNSGYYKKFFVQEKKIGSGGFGAVFLAKHVIHDIDLGYYAVKKVPVGDNRPWLNRVITEVKALESLQKHPNIVNYQHSWLEYGRVADFGPKIPCLFILMEYANGGSLADIIWNPRNRKGIPEETIWQYFIDICEGLNYLHQCGIIHRDIKPQNILLNHTISKQTGIQTTRLLISDFGTCQRDNERPFKRTGCTGTVEYTAPELLRQNDAGDYTENSDETSDIWSLGVILYSMAFGKLPFDMANLDDFNREELAHEISQFQKIKVPDGHNRSSTVVNMIEALCRANPRDRPSTVDILTCKFISDIVVARNIENPKDKKSRFNFDGSQSPFTGITRIAKQHGRLNEISTIPMRKRTISTELILRNPKISPPIQKHEREIIGDFTESNKNNNNLLSSMNFLKKRTNSSRSLSSPEWNNANILGYQMFQGVIFIVKIIFLLGRETSPLVIHFYPALFLATLSLLFGSFRSPRIKFKYQSIVIGAQFCWTLLFLVFLRRIHNNDESIFSTLAIQTFITLIHLSSLAISFDLVKIPLLKSRT